VASPVADVAGQLEAKAASFVKENRLPGAAVGIVHEDKLVWSKGIGFADVKKKRRADPKTLYRIASITKTFTATAVMQLRDEGKLALDDPLVTYLPELAVAKSTFAPIEGLTIRRLLSHESGLQSEPPDADFSLVLYESEAAKNLARAADISLTVPPNTQWKYSNLGYQLLGELVARASGMTYARYIRSKILSPLKMTSTALDPLPQRLQARRAIGYEPRFLSDELDPAPPEPGVFQAEGGLWSCVEDLARWLSCQFSPEPVLSEETAAEMHKPRYLVDPEWMRAWAIGWYARRRDDEVWIMHSGGHYGFITNACFDPKEKVGAIALLNGFGNATLLAMDLGKIAREAVKAAAPKIEAPAPLPKKWRDLVGLYVMQHFGSVISLEWRDGKLTFLDPTDPTWTPTIAPTDDPDVFVIEPGFRESGELVRVKRGKDGRVVSVIAAVSTMERLEPVGQ
jgi:CubicO group peptidase (beta-lactamase class C family)